MTRPSLSTGLSLRAQQQMVLAPRMLQSIEVLQLPGAELEVWLAEQAQGNEALSLEAPPAPPERRGTRADSDAHDEMLRNQPDSPRSVAEEVELQLAASDLDPEPLAWVRFLVTHLDPRGYLATSDEALLEQAALAGLEGGAARLGPAIAELQALEPRGVGARDAIEALLLQLDPADPDYSRLCRLLEEFIEELAKNRLPQVARAMDLELPDLERLLRALGELDPRPAAELGEQRAPLLKADLLVLPDEDGSFTIELARGALPPVSVDDAVRELARDKRIEQDVRRYLRGRIDQARAVVDAVQQRGETLQRVAQHLFAHQREWLARGAGHLVPLSMTTLADELGLHVSTVSRAVAGKHAQTPWGILPLREFFQSAAGGGDTARTDVREVVRAVFEEEDKTQPLSDDEAAAELKRRGHDLARRTIAKYRRELGVPSSYRRRRFSG
jgi:RNA polymerase sigma-54 factor